MAAEMGLQGLACVCGDEERVGCIDVVSIDASFEWWE